MSTNINSAILSTSITPASSISNSNNTSVIIGVAVGIATAIFVVLLVFVVIAYKIRKLMSNSYSVKVQSATDERVEGKVTCMMTVSMKL